MGIKIHQILPYSILSGGYSQANYRRTSENLNQEFLKRFYGSHNVAAVARQQFFSVVGGGVRFC